MTNWNRFESEEIFNSKYNEVKNIPLNTKNNTEKFSLIELNDRKLIIFELLLKKAYDKKKEDTIYILQNSSFI